ncbi:hypothetical protein EVAR_47496_1 [Eumeta japonica]|uniref:Uncharacterized protein n=1 Tax=Eumeta variegata TaxID=151549 RepID=A0A4C1XPZ0_EUMVA|nr:hypothetical protein EVAR_47496_1 [Eumeta japonica]
METFFGSNWRFLPNVEEVFRAVRSRLTSTQVKVLTGHSGIAAQVSSQRQPWLRVRHRSRKTCVAHTTGVPSFPSSSPST